MSRKIISQPDFVGFGHFYEIYFATEEKIEKYCHPKIHMVARLFSRFS